MSQRVESLRFLHLPVHLTLGEIALEVESLMDTGFDGDVSMPPELVGDARAPDESQVRAPFYRGTIRVGSLPSQPVEITALGDEPVVGRGIIDRYLVILDHGRRVIVEA